MAQVSCNKDKKPAKGETSNDVTERTVPSITDVVSEKVSELSLGKILIGGCSYFVKL